MLRLQLTLDQNAVATLIILIKELLNLFHFVGLRCWVHVLFRLLSEVILEDAQRLVSALCFLNDLSCIQFERIRDAEEEVHHWVIGLWLQGVCRPRLVPGHVRQQV